MIICISGLSGSGKNSVGTMLAQKLGLRIIDPTFKTLAAKQKMDLMDFHTKAEGDHTIDRDFDARLVADAKKGNCVVMTWLGPWMIREADLKVWLYAPKAARAIRVARRDGMTVEEAEKHIEDRDESNRLRYLEIYKIDIYDHSGFELIINSEKFAPSQSAAIIAEAVLQKAAARGITLPSPAERKANAPVAKKAARHTAQKKAVARKSGGKKVPNKNVSKKRK